MSARPWNFLKRVAIAMPLFFSFLVPAQAMVVFHQERLIGAGTTAGPAFRQDIYYLLCDSGRAFLIHSAAATPYHAEMVVDESVIRQLVGMPMCRGQGGWLGASERRTPPRIIDRPTRLDRRAGPAGTAFDALHRSCFVSEERSRFASFGAQGIPVYRCAHQVSQRFLGSWR